ncbi:hypothetical protein MA9V1_167 [Chryseobacterium phage MA9V-1]|nr:hypothetical protein MA9V1_167 [Chryseobacterium phage MA9V-1]
MNKDKSTMNYNDISISIPNIKSGCYENHIGNNISPNATIAVLLYVLYDHKVINRQSLLDRTKILRNKPKELNSNLENCGELYHYYETHKCPITGEWYSDTRNHRILNDAIDEKINFPSGDIQALRIPYAKMVDFLMLIYGVSKSKAKYLFNKLYIIDALVDFRSLGSHTVEWYKSLGFTDIEPKDFMLPRYNDFKFAFVGEIDTDDFETVFNEEKRKAYARLEQHKRSTLGLLMQTHAINLKASY